MTNEPARFSGKIARIQEFVKPPDRRLTYVATADHTNTLADLPGQLFARGVAAHVWSWERLLAARRVPRGSWILTDFDRLSPSELEAAGAIHARLSAEGVTVLNDPRRFRPRDALLRHLHTAGLNDFTCWRPAAGEWPGQFPVFLRTIAAHRGAIGELLHDGDAARAAVEQAVLAGHPLADLLLVEFCAQRQPGTGAYQKRAAFRVGERIFPGNMVNDVSWLAKHGTLGAASAAQYREERENFQRFRHRDAVAAAFEAAGMDFGRLDYGMVEGRVQSYELNTNPYMRLALRHPNRDRLTVLRQIRDALADALAAVASPATGPRVLLYDAFRRSGLLGRRPRRF